MSKHLSSVLVVAVLSGQTLTYAGASTLSPVIVVTPSAIEQPRDSANSAITVIDRETIAQSNAGSVAELLRGQAGLHIRDLFGNGQEATVDLRGFGPTGISNTLILVDGRRLNNSADQGTPDLSSINLDDIEQIEIMQGSAGVLYGNQAIGGVVNIIRRPVTVDRTRLTLRGGSYQSRRLAASMNRLLGQTRLVLSVVDQRADNYRDHNASDKQQFNLRAVRQHAGFSGYAELAVIEDFMQTPGALLSDELAVSRTRSLSFYDADFFDTQSAVLRLGFDRNLDDSQSLNVDFSHRSNEREFIQTFRPFPGSLTTQDRDTNSFSATYRLQQKSPGAMDSLIIGLQQEQTDYELQSSLGPQVIDQSIRDIYLSGQWPLGQSARIDAGIRYSDQDARIDSNDFDDSVTLFSLGYSRVLNGMKLFARADQNYRFPTVEEHTNVALGSAPGLQTQQGISYELGLEVGGQGSRFRATLYEIRLDDEIGFDASGFANLNLDETRRRGAVVEASRQWTASLRTAVSLTLLDAQISDGPFEGNQLPGVAERTLRLDAGYQYSQQLSCSLEFVAVDEQVFGGDFANQLERLDSYQVVNVHAAHRRNNWLIKFRINNLLDEEYSETGSLFTEFDPVDFTATNHEAFFPSPRRNFWLAVEVEF